MTGALDELAVAGIFSRWLLDESGADVVEFGLLVATIALVVLIALSLIGGGLHVGSPFTPARVAATGTA